MKHTVFTPVYNRAGNMLDLANYIANLDYPKSEYEWLIVDDGSTDDLKDVLDQIIKKYPHTIIRCIHKENGGIHTAQNCAIRNASGEYITRIDSDDYLLKDSLINKDKALNSIPANMLDKVVGVVGLCLNRSDKTIRGVKFPLESQITKGYLLQKKGVSGDKNFCMKTSVMKQYLLPEYEDTKWVPEGGWLWREIDKKYDTLFVNVQLSVCTEANDGSYLGSLKKMSLSNFMSIYYANLYIVNLGKGCYPLKTILKAYIMLPYSILCAEKVNKDKYRLKKMYKEVDKLFDKFIISVSLPVAFLKRSRMK